ncbi:voltage-gated potassium channel KCNC1-like [Montipora foliosa]|uniref:voltage-gated potassium channel KCNC1-like n=1 Tax=Montipora foliosa TaxID=591990 RepID=UPI0035F115B3
MSAVSGIIFDASREDRITINVGGFRHNTFLTTLKNIPDTRLSWIAENHPNSPDYNPVIGEYFFDRHPQIFTEVLNYYRTGKLHCPVDVCSAQFQDELSYWGINDRDIEPCCWVLYKRQINTEETLKTFHLDHARKTSGDEVKKERKSTIASLFGSEKELQRKYREYWRKLRPRVWALLDDPRSSMAAKVFIGLTSLFITISVTQFCLSTVTSIKENPTQMHALRSLDFVTSMWFTAEFLLRLIFCPDLKRFARNPMNWIDVLAVLPFYLSLYQVATSRTSWLVVMRTLRIFRIFSLSFSFQILFHTLMSSKNELLLVFISLIVPIILFSSMIYIVENEANREMFPSIPESFWWAIVTVTTLGYGDVVPVTKLGKIIGAMCAICGVIIIAIPVSVIGSNFSYFYMQARTRIQQPRRSTKMPTLAPVSANLMYKRFARRRSGSSNGSVNERSLVRRSSSLRGKTSTQYRKRPIRKSEHTAQERDYEMSKMLAQNYRPEALSEES